MSAPSAPQVGDQVRVTVRALAAGGAGVAELADGRVAFVHRTAPGDVVEARISRLKPRWAVAELLDVVEPGPGRVPAPCPHYAECGGCTLQHLAYEEQLVWKRRFVADALERIAAEAETRVPPVVPSPARLRYRNRVTFTVLTLPNGRRVAGFHALRHPERIVDVGSACLLPEPSITTAWEAIRAAFAERSVLPRGRQLRLTLRTLEYGVGLLIRGGASGWSPSVLLSRVPDVRSVWHQSETAKEARLLAGVEPCELWGAERVPVSGRAFLQVNRGAAQALAAHVLEQAPEPALAVDAYCGIGVYGRALARKGWRVIGIEVDAEACAAARHEAPEGFTVREGSVEELLAGALPADMVILNPPRTGLSERIPPTLAKDPPRRLVYVSCDPATLARDVRRLRGAFVLTGLACFDLFPQTSHVETVAVLSKAENPS